MNRKVRQVNEEWLVLVRFNELDGFVGQAIRKELSGRPVLQVGIFVRREITCRGTARNPRDAKIESKMFRSRFRPAQMPFADARGHIPGRLEPLRNGCLTGRQAFRPIRRRQKFRVREFFTGNVVGDVQTRRVFAGEERRAGWRAERCGGVSLGESHSLAREPVNVRCFVKWAAITAQPGPAEVIGEDENEIKSGFLFGFG